MAHRFRFPELKTFLSTVLLVGLAFSGRAESTQSYTGKGLAAEFLRCEYLVDPLGIDEPAPRLSWIVESGERGQRQTAYRVLVSTNEGSLKRDQSDLWDTGKVESDERK